MALPHFIGDLVQDVRAVGDRRATPGVADSWLRSAAAGVDADATLALFHYVGRRDAEEEQIGRIRQVIADDLAGEAVDGSVSLVSSETRDRIVENCLQIQLGDRAVAHDLYADLREQLVRSPERRYDMEVSVALAPWAEDRPRAEERCSSPRSGRSISSCR